MPGRAKAMNQDSHASVLEAVGVGQSGRWAPASGFFAKNAGLLPRYCLPLEVHASCVLLVRDHLSTSLLPTISM